MVRMILFTRTAPPEIGQTGGQFDSRDRDRDRIRSAVAAHGR